MDLSSDEDNGDVIGTGSHDSKSCKKRKLNDESEKVRIEFCLKQHFSTGRKVYKSQRLRNTGLKSLADFLAMLKWALFHSEHKIAKLLSKIEKLIIYK